VIRNVWSLSKCHELRTHLSHTVLQCLHHDSEGARCKVTGIVHRRTLLQELVEGVYPEDELENLAVAGVGELFLF